MKYTSILAGFFGLMALAACTNNDEVTMEQPKEVHTITVAFNKGANTRVQLSEFSVEEGFKGTWESTDKIGLIDNNGTTYEYSIDAATIDEETGVATFTREGDALADGTYKVVYPYDWDGNLDNFDTQDAEFAVYDEEKEEYINKFNAEKAKQYLYALGDATCEGGMFKEQATLTPIFNFIYVPMEYSFQNMKYWGFQELLEGGTRWGTWTTTATLAGMNLYNKIVNFEGTEGNITLNNISFYAQNPGEQYGGWMWESNNTLIFAFPVLPGHPVQYLGLGFTNSEGKIKYCDITNSDGSPAVFNEGGHVYVFTHDKSNLQFEVPK